MASLDAGSASPVAFEKQLRELIEKMGYRAILTRFGDDGGFVIDALDPDPVAGGSMVVQCSLSGRTVGAPEVANLHATITGERARHGILVTTTHFAPDALRLAQGKPLQLIDRERLGTLFHEYGLAAPDMGPAPAAGQGHGGAARALRGDIGITSAMTQAMPSYRWRRVRRQALFVAGALVLWLLALRFVTGGALTGSWQLVVSGLALVGLMIFSTNPAKLRMRVPWIRTQHVWESRVTYAILALLCVGTLAAVPAAHGQPRAVVPAPGRVSPTAVPAPRAGRPPHVRYARDLVGPVAPRATPRTP